MKIDISDKFIFKTNEQDSDSIKKEFAYDIIMLANILKRFLLTDQNYVNTHFNVDGDLCLDGTVKISKEERAVIENILDTANVGD